MKRACLFLLLFVLIFSINASADSLLEVRFLDVGNADAALILCDGHAMLIDGGNKSDSQRLYSLLKKEKIRSLDIVVSTHVHVDHIGGLPGALNYSDAEIVLCPVKSHSSDAFNDLKKYANKNGPGISIPLVGDTYALGSATIEVLALNSGSAINETSIVLRLEHGNVSFLFTGDAEGDTEQALLDSDIDLSATVLKVAHHGKDTSSSTRFLQAVAPSHSVISTKDEPASIVLDNLQAVGSEVYRTDLHGDVSFISDGERVFVSTEKSLAIAPVTVETKKEVTYILNINTEKFHHPSCKSVVDMKEKNKREFSGTREEAISKGYKPCKNCDP